MGRRASSALAQALTLALQIALFENFQELLLSLTHALGLAHAEEGHALLVSPLTFPTAEGPLWPQIGIL